MAGSSVTVVGSGASGVHFALTLLSRGYRVRMVDAGRSPTGDPVPEPGATLDELTKRLVDPFDFFLGKDFESVTFPGQEGEFYGFPPGKRWVFAEEDEEIATSSGFEPLLSRARGGLAEAWTAGVYPFDDEDLARFPFGTSDLLPCYSEVARRIGVSGQEDDLSRFLPLHDHLLPPLQLDASSRSLLAAYRRHRRHLNESLGFFVGRTRVASLSEPLGEREPCDYLGRCLWGCPRGAIYTPSVTLEECRAHDSFEYLPGRLVDRFRVGDGGRVVSLLCRRDDGGHEEIPVDTLALAAGTLSSSAIFLRSWKAHTGRTPDLPGLMDNRQVLVPFLQLRRLARRYDERSYQYHLLGLGIEGRDDREYVHGQITTLTTAQPHPVLQRFPFDLPTALYFFRNIRAGLGLVNLNFSDHRRAENRVRLARGEADGPARLDVRYSPMEGEARRIRRSVWLLTRALTRLGCLVALPLVHVRPMGASAHYAGTLPMTRSPRPLTLSSTCRSHDFRNLFVVDGAGFPALPAKNYTFTLMANAVRVAKQAF